MLNKTTYDIVMISLIAAQAVLAFYFIKKIIININKIRQTSKKIKQLIQNKCKAPHEWVGVVVNNSKTHVCKICYWCPSHESFVKESYVKEAIYTEEFDKKYKKYMNEKMQIISQEYNLNIDEVVEIDKKLDQAKRSFSMEHLKKMLEELTSSSREGKDD